MSNVSLSQKRMSVLHGIFGKQCESPPPLGSGPDQEHPPRGQSITPTEALRVVVLVLVGV